jgi:nucleotide sugar dehydrogenase
MQDSMTLAPAPVASAATARSIPPDPAPAATVAVIGLGYVGLPTALALADADLPVIGLDVSAQRLDDIRRTDVDLVVEDRRRLAAALLDGRLALTADGAALSRADVLLICVPTPVDARLEPDPRFVADACASVVRHARAGQTIVLSSTTYVGTTRELLVDPLERRGLLAGRDVFVAFSPERIVPGTEHNHQRELPRVLGGTTPRCAASAAAILDRIVRRVHVVSSPEAAELTKLYENTFRAVNLAFANEMADVCRRLQLDPIEITEAAATKPYGFLAHYPSAGVGGHCIPCDPYYLLRPLQAMGVSAPITEQAMSQIARRPLRVADRAEELLAEMGKSVAGARVLVVGVAFKAGVQDTRVSPGVEVLKELRARGAEISYHDPLVPRLRRADDPPLASVERPDADDYDLVVLTVLQPDHDHSWLTDCGNVLDCTYRTPAGRQRSLL